MIPSVWRYGLAGTHQTGKSSFQQRLVTELRQRLPKTMLVIAANFADPLREELNSVWPYELGNEKHHPLEREVLQATGEVWRNSDRMAWVYDSLHATESEIAVADYLLGEEAGQGIDQVIVVYGDIYHLNEAITMDRLFLVQNEYVDIVPAEQGVYEPVSVAQTKWMLRNVPSLSQLMHASGSTTRLLRVENPAHLNNDKVLGEELKEIYRLVNERRTAQGKPHLADMEIDQPRLFAEAVARRSDYVS